MTALPATAAERPPEMNGGLQLRPPAEPTGIFSAFGSSGKKQSAARAKPNPAHTGTSAAAERTKGLVPQFMSLFGGKSPQQTSAPSPQLRVTTSVGPVPRAGAAAAAPRNNAPSSNSPGAMSAQHNQPAGRPETVNQAAYHTAASTRSYGQPGHPAAAAGHTQPRPSQTHTKPSTLTNPHAIASSRPAQPQPPKAQPAAKQPFQTAADAPRSASAKLLVEAHQLSSTAKTENEFSLVVTTCREVAAGQATAEELAFSKSLAAWALNRRGQIKAAAGRNDDALADFDASVKLDPERWRAIHNRGVMLAQSGHLEEAFDDFHRTVQLNPEFAKAFSNRAALYTLAGDFDAALRDYSRAVELDPKLAVAQRGLGRTYHMLGELEVGLRHLDAAVELAPNDDAALTSRGDALTDLGYYADAAADYDRALELNTESIDACRSSAWLMATCPDQSIRNPELALRLAQLAVRSERNPAADSYATLAAAQASSGDFQRAVRTTERAIELATDAERALYEERVAMYKRSQPLRIAPAVDVQQAGYEQ
jgi:tetratricopeptide (TPR) repeat protein